MKKVIIANWKMYLDARKSVLLAKKIRDMKSKAEVVIVPSFVALHDVGLTLAQSGVELGAQNMGWSDYGAFTGETAGKDLKMLGCKYVILGHSERRKYFKENYESVNKKLLYAVKLGLTPILCVGENLRERRSGHAWETISIQLKTALKDVEKRDKLIVAYEPIWAIGTGNPEDPEDANNIHGMIRKKFLSSNDRVIYGGSINSKNFNSFLKQKNIDGLLVGGASTKMEEFSKIIK